MKRVISALTGIAFALAGCATASKDIAASSISPMQYQGYDCEQIAGEAQRLQVRVNQLGGRLDQAASNDKAIMGVGLVLFWPALFALGGTKEQEAEYSRLKGEYDAVHQAAIAKRCAGQVTASPSTPGANPAVRSPATALAIEAEAPISAVEMPSTSGQ